MAAKSKAAAAEWKKSKCSLLTIVPTLSYVSECSGITVPLWLSLYVLWSVAISDTISTLYH